MRGAGACRGPHRRTVEAVTRNPLVLAALASAAVSDLVPVSARALPPTSDDFDLAAVTDDQGREWTVRAPTRVAVSAAQESELAVMKGLRDPRFELPFVVPDPAGSADLPEGGRAIVYPHLRGHMLHPGELGPGPGLAASLGRALAALHDLPRSVIEDAGMPVYEAADYRERRMSELDRAAATGHVPSRLLTRWEHGIEDVGRWRFQSSVIHGDLVAEHVLADGDAVVGILDWSQAKVADPADDLAWVAVGSDEAALDSVLEAYSHARRDQPDRHLQVRARLAGELALARWLLHGTRTDDATVVDDAVLMLRDLDADVVDSPLQ